jgi:glycosyltransferase involved in cell wall biosynthesis
VGQPRLRVLHITTVPVSLRFLRGQGPFMAKRGIDLTAVSSPGASLQEFGRSEGVPVFAVPMTREIAPLDDARALPRLVRVIRAARPDIVHVHTPKASLLGSMAATIARVPRRIYHLRGLRLAGASGPKAKVLEAAERLTMAMATDVVAVSPSLRAEVESRGLLPLGKARVLANGSGQGVDAEHFDPSRFDEDWRERRRAQLGYAPETVVFSFVGRATRDKGVEELRRAWALVRERVPAARLRFVGPFEAGDAVSPDTAAALAADPTVHLVGPVDDPLEEYAVSDVVVLPTYREGFPNVPLEAAAMGLPAVATRVTGCVDAVVHGQTGLLVDAMKVEPLAEAMVSYALDRERRGRHGGAGRARVVRDYRREPIWEALAALYEESTGHG